MTNWYVVYTKPRTEDSTAALLNNAGIETLNPKILVQKCKRNKFVPVTEQLFPCYVFAFFDSKKHTHMITYTRGVRYIVGKETPLVVFPEIIAAIRERMDGNVVRPLPESFEKGDKVLIKEGPFKDFYGIFERNIPGKERVMILLEALQCKVDIDNCLINKA